MANFGILAKLCAARKEERPHFFFLLTSRLVQDKISILIFSNFLLLTRLSSFNLLQHS